MADTSDRPWNAIVRRRALVAAILFAMWGVAIQARLVYLQIYQHDALQVRAQNQANRTTTVEPRRGDIVDRRGRTLALSVDADSICAIPSRIEDAGAVVDAVCWVLGDCTDGERQDFLQRLGQKRRSFAFLRRKVSLETVEPARGPEHPGGLHEARAEALLPEPRAGRARAGIPEPRQQGRQRRRAILQLEGQRAAGHDPGGGRRQPACVQPRGAGAGGGRHARTDHRREPPVHRRARAGGGRHVEQGRRRVGRRDGSAVGRDPRPRQLPVVQSRTSTATSPRSSAGTGPCRRSTSPGPPSRS